MSAVLSFFKRKKSNTEHASSLPDHDSAGSSSSNMSRGHVQKIDLSIEEVSRATNNFSDGNKIGEGEFGKVYKGKLKDGTPVTVKRVPKDLYDYQSSHEFRNEILKLSKIEHHNLVKLYGFLEQGSERIIIFEYVGNGTLREHLDGFRGGGLEIAERLDITIDIAHALTYLHSYSDPPVIHRDVNSSNILITENLRARVSDFGFAKIVTEDLDATLSTQVKGSAGYLDPEYAKAHQLTERSDVYSFGILLVEMMTGRNPVEPKKSHKERVTSKWAMQKLRDGEVVLVMDIKLKRTPASLMVVEQILKLARYCLAPQRQSRPSMKNCVEALWKIRKELTEKHISLTASATHHTMDVNANVKEHHRKMFGIEEIDKRFLSA
ncbi:calmodulin-binding receptor-like cytoplasmic kinase 1 [Impatiens glandulifera]|uniref:calmodulin-binding receptor-like cytoplasmic kinase 1 n=1 Tax=Impatiens glandulifera TaxID=253017 RepID=UPI001FB1760A|nr:calmodulin-binding receptor-like cytoplasmic kinase 1 [Impatiens glandulifera]